MSDGHKGEIRFFSKRREIHRMKLLIAGCGYLGQRIGHYWLQHVGPVTAMTRSVDRAEALRQLGFSSFVADWLHDPEITIPTEVDAVLIAVSHRPPADLPADQTHVTGLEKLFASEKLGKIRKLVYISTTGVYSQIAGELVSEASPTHASRGSSLAALSAEKWLERRLLPGALTTLRLAGIYGPNRVPRIEDLRKGTPLEAGEGFLNLIHVDDAAMLSIEALQRSDLNKLYVVSDGNAVLRPDFYAEVARQAGTPVPNLIPPTAGSPKGMRSESNKRIDITNLLQDFKTQLKYPNYIEGLRSIFHGSASSGAATPER